MSQNPNATFAWVSIAFDPHDLDVPPWIAAGKSEAGARSALNRRMRTTYAALADAGASEGDFTEWAEQFTILDPEQVEVE